MFYFIDLKGYGVFAMFLLFPFMLISHLLSKNFDKNSLILLIFSLTFVSFLFIYRNAYSVVYSILFSYLIFPVMMYSLGKYFQKKYYSDSSFYKIVFFVLIMFSFIAFISIASDISKNGYMSLERNIHLLNSKSSMAASATLVNSMIVPFLALCGTLLVPVSKADKKCKYVFLLFSVIALVFSVRLGSRTGLVVFVLSPVLNFIFFRRYIPIKRRLFYFVLLSIFFVYVSKISMEDSDMFFSYQDRLASADFGNNSAGGRTAKWEDGFNNMIKYPMGVVANVPGISYSHNFWLDIARVAGVIPMFFMLVFCIRMLYITYKLIKKQSVSMLKKSILLSLNIGFFSVFAVEPIIEANFTFVSVYFFFSGMVYAFYKQTNRYLISR